MAVAYIEIDQRRHQVTSFMVMAWTCSLVCGQLPTLARPTSVCLPLQISAKIFGLKLVLPDLRQQATLTCSSLWPWSLHGSTSFYIMQRTSFRTTTVLFSVSPGMTVCVAKCFGMGQLPLPAGPRQQCSTLSATKLPGRVPMLTNTLCGHACTLPCKNTLN